MRLIGPCAAPWTDYSLCCPTCLLSWLKGWDGVGSKAQWRPRMCFPFSNQLLFSAVHVSHFRTKVSMSTWNSPYQQSAVKSFSLSARSFGPSRECCERSGDDSVSGILRIIRSRVCIKTLRTVMGLQVTHHTDTWNDTKYNQTQWNYTQQKPTNGTAKKKTTK